MGKTSSVSVQMSELLEEFKGDVEDATNSAIDSVSREAVQKLKNTSPKRPGGGEYANGWTRKKGNGRVHDVTIYNRKYQLTHLLENGHVIRNEYGTFGRTNGIKHIAPVEEWASNELPSEIERKL